MFLTCRRGIDSSCEKEDQPRLILGKNDDDVDLILKEKQTYNRVTFSCPKHMSGKQAGKLVANLSKMMELHPGFRGSKRKSGAEEFPVENVEDKSIKHDPDAQIAGSTLVRTN